MDHVEKTDVKDMFKKKSKVKTVKYMSRIFRPESSLHWGSHDRFITIMKMIQRQVA